LCFCTAVSILILLEIVLEDSLPAVARINTPGFNPYSAGDSSGSLQLLLYRLVVATVSILILLEIVLEVLNQLIYSKRLIRFNPYSAGDSSGRARWRNWQTLK